MGTPSEAGSPEGVADLYKRAFLKGLAGLLPAVLTVYVLVATWNFIETSVATPLNDAIKSQLTATRTGREFAVRFLKLEPELLWPENEARFLEAVDESFPSWVGFVAAIILCFMVGFFVASFLGRRLWGLVEGWFTKLPVVRAIYPSAKQITDFFLKRDEAGARRFSRVCFVPFPTSDQWALGFVMSNGFNAVDERLGKRYVNVFLPMAPTPVTGFVVLVAEEDIHPIDLSVDEAFQYYLTAGLVVPARHSVPAEPGD